MSDKMSDDKLAFLADLRDSRVKLCKRAATSLSSAWSECDTSQERIKELEALLDQYKNAIKAIQNSPEYKMGLDKYWR